MSQKLEHISIEAELRTTLCRLARFGANITDSHSCFIFLPPAFLNRQSSSADELLIGGYHSLCNDILEGCSIRNGSGLIGWVARHEQPIHVSPFEHDSRTLGMYREDRELKSFIGIPITLRNANGKASSGVIACDSKKSFAFSKLQGKLLADLAVEVSSAIELLLSQVALQPFPSWSEFITTAEETVTTLGVQSIDVMRLRIDNYNSLEKKLGSSECVELCQQLYRLLQQSLPPHFPYFQLPNGDFLIVMDNMMSSFYKNRIMALAEHIQSAEVPIALAFNRVALYTRKRTNASLEHAIGETLFNDHTLSDTGDTEYEHRRA